MFSPQDVREVVVYYSIHRLESHITIGLAVEPEDVPAGVLKRRHGRDRNLEAYLHPGGPTGSCHPRYGPHPGLEDQRWGLVDGQLV